jgi:hypothetical protein
MCLSECNEVGKRNDGTYLAPAVEWDLSLYLQILSLVVNNG